MLSIKYIQSYFDLTIIYTLLVYDLRFDVRLKDFTHSLHVLCKNLKTYTKHPDVVYIVRTIHNKQRPYTKNAFLLI